MSQSFNTSIGPSISTFTLPSEFSDFECYAVTSDHISKFWALGSQIEQESNAKQLMLEGSMNDGGFEWRAIDLGFSLVNKRRVIRPAASMYIDELQLSVYVGGTTSDQGNSVTYMSELWFFDASTRSLSAFPMPAHVPVEGMGLYYISNGPRRGALGVIGGELMQNSVLRMAPMNVTSIYDFKTETWYQQTLTGLNGEINDKESAVPVGRLNPCVIVLGVGISSLHNSYEEAVKLIAPIYYLNKADQTLSALYIDYTRPGIPILEIFQAFWGGHWLVAAHMLSGWATLGFTVFLGVLQQSTSSYGSTSFDTDRLSTIAAKILASVIVLANVAVGWQFCSSDKDIVLCHSPGTTASMILLVQCSSNLTDLSVRVHRLSLEEAMEIATAERKIFRFGIFKVQDGVERVGIEIQEHVNNVGPKVKSKPWGMLLGLVRVLETLYIKYLRFYIRMTETWLPMQQHEYDRNEFCQKYDDCLRSKV